ncbi:hypothetical protein ZWY2020_057216 [Hordeum vulgare]|nr:hypothetical protein ZWY2020_057216 [Hordeum vulgare]
MDRLGGITQTDLEYMLHDEDAEPMAMPFPLLEKITDYFSDESIIGRGGYAVVHKAVLDNGTVAVKRLSNTHMNEELFLREVECLMKAKHRNIVRFLGYCSDTQGNIFDYDGKKIMADVRQRLLCYEYLRKGSLDNYIKDSLGELKWRKRYHIIKGICDGLNYLHENYILHLDLKPGNILLDDDMMPKITDFGLSRCLEKGQTRVITKHVAGTIGYLAPECYRSEITITHKVDLYSLGVIIMELLTGKKGCGNIEDVRESWSYKSDILWWEQIREVKLKALYTLPRDIITSSSKPISPRIKINFLQIDELSTYCFDTNHDKQWIITGHDRGYVRIWDYKTQRKVDSLKISATHAIKCVKFIARMKWIVAGTKNTDVHVYNFETMQKITSFRIAVSGAELVSLAIHPTQPYLLSVDFYIKLWDWDKNWECIRTFEYQNYLTCPVVLNPNNSFATASGDCTVEQAPIAWNLKLDQSMVTLGFKRCALDGSKAIWDLKKRKCIITLEATSPVLCVLARANLPILITGTKHGIIHVWSSTDFSLLSYNNLRNYEFTTLQRAINLGGGGPIIALEYLVDSQRVVIGQGNTFSSMDKHGNFIDFKRALRAKRRTPWLAAMAATRFLRMRTSEKHRLGKLTVCPPSL